MSREAHWDVSLSVKGCTLFSQGDTITQVFRADGAIFALGLEYGQRKLTAFEVLDGEVLVHMVHVEPYYELIANIKDFDHEGNFKIG